MSRKVTYLAHCVKSFRNMRRHSPRIHQGLNLGIQVPSCNPSFVTDNRLKIAPTEGCACLRAERQHLTSFNKISSIWVRHLDRNWPLECASRKYKEPFAVHNSTGRPKSLPKFEKNNWFRTLRTMLVKDIPQTLEVPVGGRKDILLLEFFVDTYVAMRTFHGRKNITPSTVPLCTTTEIEDMRDQ